MSRINPISRLKNWLSAAIDWRVREEVKGEHEVVMALSKTVAHVSAELTDQLRTQSVVIEDLQRRVRNLEEQSRP